MKNFPLNKAGNEHLYRTGYSEEEEKKVLPIPLDAYKEEKRSTLYNPSKKLRHLSNIKKCYSNGFGKKRIGELKGFLKNVILRCSLDDEFIIGSNLVFSTLIPKNRII